VRGCNLEDNPAEQDLQGTYRGTDIEKFNVPCYREGNGSLSLRDEQGYVFLPPDASPRVGL